MQQVVVSVFAVAAVVVSRASCAAGWTLGTSLEVVDGPEIVNNFNKIELESNRLVRLVLF